MVYVTYSPAKKPKHIRHSKASTSLFYQPTAFFAMRTCKRKNRKQKGLWQTPRRTLHYYRPSMIDRGAIVMLTLYMLSFHHNNIMKR